MHKKLENPYYGTTNLHKRAETWVWVVTDVQNFALRAPCALALPLRDIFLPYSTFFLGGGSDQDELA